MTKRNLIVLISAASLLTLSLFAGAQTARLLKGRPTAIGVVDVEKVFNTLAEKMQIEADLNTRQENLKKERDSREKELRDLKKDLEVLNASNPAFKTKQEELEKKVFDLQAWAQWQTNMLSRENRLQITGLYNKITSAAGKVAKDSGYDVVLFKEPAADFGNVTPEQLSMALRSRKVLWTAEDLDLTEQVVQAMNNDYKNVVKPK
ncbi:MAG: OmpH family outer membrane protein [Planctomycetes bacterium]|nr:OmpH family outer membrane protein [Planctomycetota bacterium]